MPPSSFIVVECQTPPNDNKNKWVCVPKSWIQCELSDEDKVAVGYPAEDEICITKRITNNEPGSKTWPLYIGIIKYEAESYEDAVVGFLEQNVENIEEKSGDKSFEEEFVVVEKSVEKIEEKTCNKSFEEEFVVVEKSVEKIEEKTCNIQESYEGAVGDLVEKTENQIKEKTSEIVPEGIPKDSLKLRIVLPKLNLKPEKKNKSLKRYLKEQSKDSKIHKSKLRSEEKQALKENAPRKKKESTSDSGDSGVAEGSSRSEPKPSQSNAETSQKSLETKIEDVIVESLQQSLKEININDSPNKSRRTISECLDIEADDEIDLSNSNLTPEDKRTVATLLKNQRNTGGYIKAVLVHMKTLYMKYVEDKKTLDALVLKLKNQTLGPVSTETQPNDQALEEENTLSDDMETLRFDEEMESEDEEEKPAEENGTTLMDAEEQNLLEEIDSQMERDGSDFETFIDDEESSLSSEPSTPSTPEPVKRKKRNTKINRYLENSPWSLKHPDPGYGLVPFGRNNYAYIRAKKLEEIEAASKGTRMFARELCRAIFRPQALRTCTMTGRSRVSKKTKFMRPPLHFGATNDIISYSLSYGVTKGWEDADKKTLVRSLRSLLQNSRRVLKKQ